MEQEEFVATLLYPDEYQRNRNQVAALSSEYITFLNPTFGPPGSGDLTLIALHECVSVSYEDRKAGHVFVMGVLLCVCAPLLFIHLIRDFYWRAPGVGAMVGFSVIFTCIGWQWARGSRRHELTFVLRGGREVAWKSRPGDFKYKQASVDKVIAFAKSRRLFIEQER